MSLADIGVRLSGGAQLLRALITTPRKLSREQRWLTIAAALVAGIGFAILSHARLSHVVPTVRVDNAVFGADTVENYRGVSTGQYGIFDPRKHALAQIAFSILTAPQVWLGVSRAAAAINTLALLVGMLAASFLVLCIRLGASLRLAVASCLLLLSTNGFAIQTAVVETYILTALTSAVAFLVFLDLADHVAARPVWCAMFAGIAAGIAGLSNTPAAAIVLAYCAVAWYRLGDRTPLARAVLAVAVPCAIAIACAVLPSVLRDFAHRDAPLQWAWQYTNHWASVGNFSNAALTSDYAVTAVAFSWVSIGVEPICRYTSSDFLFLAHAPLAVLGLVGSLALVACAARRIAGDRDVFPLALGLVSICGVILAFYWYFNPWEGMLYSSQWMLPLACLIVLGVKRIRGAAVAVAVVAVALFVANEPLRWPGRETFASACPADHLPPWERTPGPGAP
jgi:hypothetical protein